MSEYALVTGAGGYVGRALCVALRARGWRVRSALHGTVSAGESDTVALELEDVAAGRVDPGLLLDVTVVFHLAGLAHRGADPAAQQRVNCDATLALASAANAAGVRHFVYVSSLYAGDCDPAAPLRAGDGYARSKRLAESGLLERELRWPMRVTVLRPALVYGGAMKGRLATLQRLASRGLLPELPPAGNTPMLALPDLVAALLLVGSHPTISGNVFTASDGQRYPLDRIARALRRAAGRARAAWRVPPFVLALALRAAAVLVRLPAVGTRFALPRGLSDWTLATDARLRALGWKPAHTLESALRVDDAVVPP